MQQIAQIQTTADSADAAQQIAAKLIDQSLVACVQIDGPFQSHYRWQGQLETAQEWRLTCKASLEKQNQAVLQIQKLHSYDVPEIMVVHVDTSSDYGDWVDQQCSRSQHPCDDDSREADASL